MLPAARRLAGLAVLALFIPACRRGEIANIAPAEPVPVAGSAAKRAPLAIKALYPPSAVAGVPFKTLKDGSSALGIAGEGFTHRTRVFFDTLLLDTGYQNPRALAASVPPELLARPRRVAIVVRDSRGPDGRVARATFEILPPLPPGTVAMIRILYPGSVSVAGSGRSPDGSLGMGVEGSGFSPGTEIVFDKVALPTTYQGPSALNVVVPARLLESPRKVSVTARDRFRRGARSPAVSFEIRP